MTDKLLRRMLEGGATKQREAKEKEGLAAERQRMIEEFQSTDKSSIERLKDSALAAWQAQFPRESPQFVFAEQLWRYRLARKSAKFAALIAALSALVGAIVGYTIRIGEEVPKGKANAEEKQNVSPPVPNKPGKSE